MDSQLTHEYLSLIERHVITPLKSPQISESCYATLLMLFGCIDGLGKLIHPDDKAGPGDRFKYFVARLGPKYEACKHQLWSLRNSVAHNALNVAVYLSHVPSTSAIHLHQSRPGTQFIVNTQCFLSDFIAAFSKLREELGIDSDLAKRAEGRLTYGEIPATEFEEWQTTPPPPVRFVQMR